MTERLLIQNDVGCEIRNLVADKDDAVTVTVDSTFPNATLATWSESGCSVAMIRETGEGKWEGLLVDPEGKVLFKHVFDSRIRRIAVSPRGGFVSVCFAPQDVPGDNVLLFSVDSEKPISTFKLVNYVDLWPVIKISRDEIFMAKNGLSGMKVYVLPSRKSGGGKVVALPGGKTMRQPTISECSFDEPAFEIASPTAFIAFAISPERLNSASNYFCYLGSYVAPNGQQPGRGRVYSSEFPTEAISHCNTTATSSELYFAPSGNALLVEAKSDVDSKGKSYYGVATLNALSTQSNKNTLLVSPADAPLHGFRLRPGTDHVMLGYGNLPCNIQLCDINTRGVMGIFEKARRNYFAFDCSGTMLLSGAFGSLAGDIDVHDLTDGSLMGSVRVEDIVSASWMLNGSFAILSTTSPRLRVDNKFVIMRYNGDIIYKENFKQLFSCVPQPVFYDEKKHALPQKKTLKVKAPVTPTDTPQSYIPPSQRGKKQRAVPKAKQQARPKGAVMTATNAAKTTESVKQESKIGFKMPF